MPLYRPRSRCYPSPPNRSLSRMDKGRMQGRMQRLHWFLCTRSYDRAGMPSKILVAKRNVSVHECAGDLKTTTVEMNTRMLQVVECRRALGPARFEPGPVSSSRSCLRQSQPRPEPPTDRTVWPIRRRSIVVKAQRRLAHVRLRVGPGVHDFF